MRGEAVSRVMPCECTGEMVDHVVGEEPVAPVHRLLGIVHTCWQVPDDSDEET